MKSNSVWYHITQHFIQQIRIAINKTNWTALKEHETKQQISLLKINKYFLVHKCLSHKSNQLYKSKFSFVVVYSTFVQEVWSLFLNKVAEPACTTYTTRVLSSTPLDSTHSWIHAKDLAQHDKSLLLLSEYLIHLQNYNSGSKNHRTFSEQLSLFHTVNLWGKQKIKGGGERKTKTGR